MAKNSTNSSVKKKPKPTKKILNKPIPLTFRLVDTTVIYNEGLRVIFSVEPVAQNPQNDPEYTVFIDQSRLSEADRDAGYSMLTLGIQSGAERTVGNTTKKTGAIEVLEVFGSDVKLGRSQNGSTTVIWDSQVLNKGKIIPPYLKDESVSKEYDGEFIKCSAAIFGLRVYHINGSPKRPTRWGPPFGPDGTNVPPPIPPGSSVGD